MIARAHLMLACFWVAMVLPTWLWWSDSVLWVSLVSLYANAVSHLAAYGAARAEKKSADAERAIRERVEAEHGAT